MNKMKPEIKALWIEALRSGEYVQGKGALRSADDKFCCLGVLCDLAEKAGIVSSEVAYECNCGCEVGRQNIYRYEGSTGVLPYSVMEWSGVDANDGEYSVSGYSGSKGFLTDLNDSRNYSFNQIANVIKKEF